MCTGRVQMQGISWIFMDIIPQLLSPLGMDRVNKELGVSELQGLADHHDGFVFPFENSCIHLKW